MYVLAILLPPLAVLLSGRLFGFLVNLLLTCLGWIPGVIHAICVVSDTRRKADMDRLARSLR